MANKTQIHATVEAELEEKIKFWTNETYHAKNTIKQLEKKILHLESLLKQSNQNIAAEPPENYNKLNS
jgi:uncharacterized protein (DUF342 family)